MYRCTLFQNKKREDKSSLAVKTIQAPIQWQHGALARLKPGEVIDPLLFNGYSTISLGYAGLAVLAAVLVLVLQF